MSNTANAQRQSVATNTVPEPADLLADDGVSEYTLYISIYRLRAVVVILLMVIVVLGTMLPFAGNGVRIETFKDSDVGTRRQKEMLDKYNSISGGLTVLLSKPLDMFLSMVVSVIVLCVATKCSVHHENQRRYLAIGVIGVIGFWRSSSPNATVASDVRDRVVEYYSKADNKSVTDELAIIEFSHVDISDTITFDALTIEIPTLKYGEQTDNSSSLNPFYLSLSVFLCNAAACILHSDFKEFTASGIETTIYPRVQALAICINNEGGEELVADFKYYEPSQLYQSCDQRSNTSMIIISVGKRIEGDSLESSSEEGYAARVVNARIVYSLSVGHLARTLEDLSDTYGAECASTTGCRGIRFQLESGDNLLVSEHAIQMSSLSPINLNANFFSVGDSQWKILAGTVKEMRGAGINKETRPALIVLPRNFKRADNSIAEYMHPQDSETLLDKYLNHVEKNHLYIEHTLQPAYTAGFYFIFQNAVVTKQVPSNMSVFSTKSSLAFLGNIQEMNVQASIPTTNLLLAVAGCIAVLIGGVITVVLGKRGEQTLLEQGTAATAAEAISNPDKFPPFLLRMRLRDRVREETEALVDSLQVKHVVFADDTKNFVVGGK